MNALKTLLLCGIGTAVFTSAANAQDFNIPGGDLRGALSAYMKQSGVTLMYPSEAVKGIPTEGAHGQLSPDAALLRILDGTGFAISKDSSGVIAIVRKQQSAAELPPMQFAQAAPSRAAVETVTVTSSKLGGADVQSIPIAITALSQEQLTATQTAGGPDLVKQVPNLTFTKTNFTGYSIQIRGIGTQAISVTTDPAVAVALNDIPFIRNHFFEQEFFDLSQAEVLRGPQGTLYGRNATAGVVNLVTARPTDQFEAMMSGDIGNYKNRRFEAMINLPIVDDRLDVRVAGEWTKRDGYSFNELTGSPIDGRDLWSGRISIGIKPFSRLSATLVWEHFHENDDRIRSSKQLCKTDPGPDEVGGVSMGPVGVASSTRNLLSQGCLPSSLYADEAFEVPNGFSLGYYTGLESFNLVNGDVNPYANVTQSRNLRVIESALNPIYKAKNDIVELNADYVVTPKLTLSSQTGFSHDFLWSTEDYNRFNTSPGIFMPTASGSVSSTGTFCDPQLGCSDRLVAEDVSSEHSWQLSQEFRVSSKFDGLFNFSAGGNFLHYETEENYYVLINSLTIFSYENPNSHHTSSLGWIPGTTDNSDCLAGKGGVGNYPNLNDPVQGFGCSYIDPNPLSSLNNDGHNYFLSQNPYVLNSYAAFGEAYVNVANDLKLIGGLRWTDDHKHFVQIPSWLVVIGWGYPVAGVVDQRWSELTGRLAANWTPKLDFTDQTLIYGSYSRGYKAGGANPPGAILLNAATPVHPLTFEPEFINAFELGTKNTLLDGALTFNGNVFYYDYKGYQISQIVDRTSVNLNFNATVKGAEVEATWEPIAGLKFGFAGGYEKTRLADGSKAVDLIDRTAGHSGWVVVKPSITQASNCILPIYVINSPYFDFRAGGGQDGACYEAYTQHLDPSTDLPFVDTPSVECIEFVQTLGECEATQPISGYAGFDPVGPTSSNNGAGPTPNNGAGFNKDLSGNELPNAPRFTTSFSAEYSLPVSEDWAATLHSDFYWQADSFARVFNDRPYDEIHGYTNLNFALILTGSQGWQVMGYLKNAFNTTAITGDFLNSDDTGLTTNVFLTDPRLFGVRVTKNF